MTKLLQMYLNDRTTDRFPSQRRRVFPPLKEIPKKTSIPRVCVCGNLKNDEKLRDALTDADPTFPCQ